MAGLTVKSDGVELRVIDRGSKNKTTLLFLHGFPDCHEVWSHQIDALSKDYRVIAFDLRGAGESTSPDSKSGYSMRHMLKDIDAVLDATVGSEAKVHLIGHDWGSIIGWSYVMDRHRSSRLLSWTSMSGPHIALAMSRLQRSLMVGSTDHRKAAIDQLAHSWYTLAMFVPGFGRGLVSLKPAQVWRAIMRMGGVSADDPYLDKTATQAKALLNNWPMYSQNLMSPEFKMPPRNCIHVPTQLIVPLDDAFVRPILFRGLERYVTNLSKVEIDANHWAQRQQPEMITSLIRDFVASFAEETAAA